MKKLLLIGLLSLGFVSNSQNCVSIKSTGFPTANLGLGSISLFGANVVWASAASGQPLTNRRITLSTNAGETFTPKNVTLYPNVTDNNATGIGNICGIDASTAFLCGYPGPGTNNNGVWKTTDSGTTWTRQNTAAFNTVGSSYTNFVHFFNANDGVTMGDPAGGYFEVYTTINGGTNWTRVPSANLPIPRQDLVDIEYGLNNKFIAVGNTIWFGTTYGRLIRSTDKGLTWTAFQTPVADFGGALNAPTGYSANMTFTDDNNGAINDSEVNVDGTGFTFWRTSNGGLTWIENAVGVPHSFDLSYIPGTTSLINSGPTVDTAPSGTRGTAISTDNGVTWTECPDTSGSFGGIIAVGSADYYFISGFATSATVGGIWKHDGTLASPTFSNDNAFKASPNPTTGLVALTGKNITNVIVTDVLGKQISTTNYVNLNEVNVDMTNFNAGMYMVKVTNTDGNTSTIKVVRR